AGQDTKDRASLTPLEEAHGTSARLSPDEHNHTACRIQATYLFPSEPRLLPSSPHVTTTLVVGVYSYERLPGTIVHDTRLFRNSFTFTLRISLLNFSKERIPSMIT